RVVLHAPPSPAPGDPPAPGALPADDPLAGLALEPVTRPANPPATGDLNNPLLRGETVPATYQPSTTAPPTVRLEVGRVRSEPVPFPFSP
ncbi:MAG TPA: hypothetical protein VJ966_19140, partial [Actinomycetes bacterium]|nr:hypothetical protein [Actinomycetes bacterium]